MKRYIYTSPFRDRDGRRVIFYHIGKIDLQKYSTVDVQRADALALETLTDDEETQINGLSHVICAEGAGPGYMPLFMTNDFAHLIKWGQQSYPIRHKTFTIINFSPYAKYLYDVVKGLLSPKIRSRFNFDSSYEKLQQRLGKKCLPLELGGIVPQKEMAELYKEELAARRDRLLSFDKIKLLSTRGIITSKNCPTQDMTGSGSLDGSFRKLNID